MSLVDIKSVTITEKGQIALPKAFRDSIGLESGQKIAILTYEDHIELRPLDKLTDKLYPALMSEKSLAKHWNSKEDEEAWKNL